MVLSDVETAAGNQDSRYRFVGRDTCADLSAAAIRRALERADIPTINLLDCDGRVGDKVKVGTIKRAEGLEFKEVLLADIQLDWLVDPESSRNVASAQPHEDVAREQRTLLRRELYVAMTRARDGLWLGVM